LLHGTTGQAGSSASQLKYPWSIAFDHQHQQVIISDCGNCRLQFFSRCVVEADVDDDGVHRLKHLKTFGSQGERLGQFKFARGLSSTLHFQRFVKLFFLFYLFPNQNFQIQLTLHCSLH
jgi:hypothetical protein